jgi:hypothetical protein
VRSILLLALLAGCGDNYGGASDASQPVDARHFADASLAACSGDPDAGCGSEPLTPVCDPDRGVCVECLGHGDCDRPDALGPDCVDGRTCQCDDEADCEGNRNGPRCHEVVKACTCIDDGDCGGERTCKMEPYLGGGVRTCQAQP